MSMPGHRPSPGSVWVSWELAGCGHVIPIMGTFHGEGKRQCDGRCDRPGSFSRSDALGVDPGNMIGTVDTALVNSPACPCARIGPDRPSNGLLLNQKLRQSWFRLVIIRCRRCATSSNAAFARSAGRAVVLGSIARRQRPTTLRHHGRRAAPIPAPRRISRSLACFDGSGGRGGLSSSRLRVTALWLIRPRSPADWGSCFNHYNHAGRDGPAQPGR